MAKIMSMDGGVGTPTEDKATDAEVLTPARDEARPETPAEEAPVAIVPVNTDEPSESEAPRKRVIRGKLILAVVLALVLGIGGYYGHQWWTVGRFMVSTDDAYVGANTATIAPKVAGYIKSVPVKDNEHVTAGTPLVVLDDSDYRVALSQAEAQIATQKATIVRIGQQLVASNAAVASADAELDSAKAAAANAKTSYDRVAALAAKSFASKQAADAARTALTQANAAVAAAEAAASAARANVAVVAAQKTEAERVLDQYNFARDAAQLNLDHTIIRAPFDGVVGNRAAEPGEFVATGTRLMALVPLKNVYVDANFKETQLAELKPGQTVNISVDAYPDQAVKGVVESVAPASGSVFSLLPADNATGNFTKIVQRVAVRIRLLPDAVDSGLIRPGMSVVADIDTRTGPANHVAAR